MKTKREIVSNWLTRYTGLKLEEFGKYILLTNFQNYVDLFAEWNTVEELRSMIREHMDPSFDENEVTQNTLRSNIFEIGSDAR